MATSSFPSESDQIVASAVYDLGAALARFRYYAEVNYAGGGGEDDPDDTPPAVIGASYRDVVVAAHRVAEAVPVVTVDATTLVAVTQACRDVFTNAWRNDDHVVRLKKREKATAAGVERASYVDWCVLSGSSLAPPAWAEYQAAVDRLHENLPVPFKSVYPLSPDDSWSYHECAASDVKPEDAGSTIGGVAR